MALIASVKYLFSESAGSRTGEVLVSKRWWVRWRAEPPSACSDRIYDQDRDTRFTIETVTPAFAAVSRRCWIQSTSSPPHRASTFAPQAWLGMTGHRHIARSGA